MGTRDNLKELDLSKLTPEQEAAATILGSRAANWAIQHAKTKFTEEEKVKIRAEARRRFLMKALEESDSKDAVKDESAK